MASSDGSALWAGVANRLAAMRIGPTTGSSARRRGVAAAELASQALTPVAPQGSQASSTVGNESVFQDPSEERLESALGMAFDPEKESAMKYAKRACRLAEAERKNRKSCVWGKGSPMGQEEQLEALKAFFRELVMEEV